MAESSSCLVNQSCYRRDQSYWSLVWQNQDCHFVNMQPATDLSPLTCLIGKLLGHLLYEVLKGFINIFTSGGRNIEPFLYP